MVCGLVLPFCPRARCIIRYSQSMAVWSQFPVCVCVCVCGCVSVCARTCACYSGTGSIFPSVYIPLSGQAKLMKCHPKDCKLQKYFTGNYKIKQNLPSSTLVCCLDLVRTLVPGLGALFSPAAGISSPWAFRASNIPWARALSAFCLAVRSFPSAFNLSFLSFSLSFFLSLRSISNRRLKQKVHVVQQQFNKLKQPC